MNEPMSHRWAKLQNAVLECLFWNEMALGATTPELADLYVQRYYTAIQSALD